MLYIIPIVVLLRFQHAIFSEKLYAPNFPKGLSHQISLG
jgi:hypothetical protein